MLTISCAPAAASSDAGGPARQMSSQTVSPTRVLADLDDRPATAGAEVALLVEDAVVGQVVLAVDLAHGAVGEHRGGVVDGAVLGGGSGNPTTATMPRVVARELGERAPRVAQEVLAQQQVLGRVAGQRQLGEQHQLGAGGARRVDPGADALRVAGDVADGGVHLAEGQAHGG